MQTKSWIDKIFMPNSIEKEFTFDTYLSELDSGKYRDRFIFGISENQLTPLMVDQQKSAYTINALYVGSMGSGKSKAAVFSLITWFAANSDQTLLFIVDPLKGANDYNSLLDSDSKGKKLYKQIYPILSSEQGIIRLVDLLYDEAMTRREKFNEVQAESFLDYEKKTGKKIARIITLMEEFHAIPYAIMNFYPDFKTDLTTANKFHTLMRIGRSYGINFIACTQKSTKSDIPPEMTPNFVNKNVFRVSRGEAAYLLGDNKAAEITPQQQGRCITEYGPAQFPLFTPETEKRILKKYGKPLSAECFYLTHDIIVDVLSGKSTKDQYKHKKLTDLIKGIESYNTELVITLLHEKQGHRVEPIDSKIDNFGISHIIHWNNDIKVAVLTRCLAHGKKITGKHIGRLKKAMDMYECTHGIIYTSLTDLPNSLYKVANPIGIEIVDHDDMFKLAYKVELEGDKLNISPDHLADNSKESGEYQISLNDDDNEYNTGSFDDFQDPSHILDDSQIIDLDKIEKEKQVRKDEITNEKINKINEITKKEALEIEKIVKEEIAEPNEETIEEVLEELKQESFSDNKIIEKEEKPLNFSEDKKDLNKDLLISTPILNKSVKREKVTKICTIKQEDSPSLLVHVMKSESKEVFRVLFYILDNMQIKHKYFLDKKIEKDFSFKEKQFLGVTSSNEWNNQKETLNQEDFNKEFINYLENFSKCAFPVHSICWQEDEEFLSKYLRQCPYMIRNSTIIEKHTSAFFNNHESRADLIKKMDIKKSKVGIFNPIEIDLEIWKNTN